MLLLPDSLPGERGAAQIGSLRETAGSLDERRQRLPLLEGIGSGEPDFAVKRRGPIQVPFGDGQHKQVIVHLQRNVVLWVACRGLGKIDAEYVGLRPCLGRRYPRHLRLVKGVVEQSARQRNDILHFRHAGVDAVFSGMNNRTGNCDGIGTFGNREYPGQVAILKHEVLCRVSFDVEQISLEQGPGMMILDPLHLQPSREGVAGQAAGHLDQVKKPGLPLQLVDRRGLDRSGDPRKRPDRRDEDHVFRHEAQVPGFVPLQQKIVEIESDHRLAVPLNLDIAHGAGLGRAATLEQGVDDGRERRQGVGSRPLRIPHDIDLDGPEWAHADVHFEAGIVL